MIKRAFRAYNKWFKYIHKYFIIELNMLFAKLSIAFLDFKFRLRTNCYGSKHYVLEVLTNKQ